MSIYEDYEYEVRAEVGPDLLTEETSLDSVVEALPVCERHETTYHLECLRCSLEALREQARPIEYRQMRRAA